jgi:hypothetical protein
VRAVDACRDRGRINSFAAAGEGVKALQLSYCFNMTSQDKGVRQ